MCGSHLSVSLLRTGSPAQHPVRFTTLNYCTRAKCQTGIHLLHRHTFATALITLLSNWGKRRQTGERKERKRESEVETNREQETDKNKRQRERWRDTPEKPLTSNQAEAGEREQDQPTGNRAILTAQYIQPPTFATCLPPPPQLLPHGTSSPHTFVTQHIQPSYLCHTAPPTFAPSSPHHLCHKAHPAPYLCHMAHPAPYLCHIQPPTVATSSPPPLPHPAPYLCHMAHPAPPPPTFATSSPLPLPLSTSSPLPLPHPALYLCYSAHPAPYLGDEDAVGLQQLSDVLRSGQQLPHLPPQRLGDSLAHQPRHLLGSHGQVAVPAGQHLRPRLQQVAVLHLLAHVPRPAQQRLVRVCRTTHTARSDPMTLSVLHVVVHGCYCTDRFLTQEFPTSWTSGIGTDSKEKTPPPPPPPHSLFLSRITAQKHVRMTAFKPVASPWE